jgi:hypothetical protein
MAGGEAKLRLTAGCIGLYAATGGKMKERGMTRFRVQIGGDERWLEFLVVEGLSTDIILGCGWQKEAKAVIDWGMKTIRAERGVDVPMARKERGKRKEIEELEKPREEVELRVAKKTTIPGRSIRCIHLGMTEEESSDKERLGYFRGVEGGGMKGCMTMEGVAVARGKDVYIAMVNPYPKAVVLGGGRTCGVMTMCEEEEMEERIEVREMTGKNLFTLGVSKLGEMSKERGKEIKGKEQGAEGVRVMTIGKTERGEGAAEEAREEYMEGLIGSVPNSTD